MNVTFSPASTIRSGTPASPARKKKYSFSPEFSQSVVAVLRAAAAENPINLVMSDFSYNYVYAQCCKKLTIAKPVTAQYLELMQSDQFEEISQLTNWVILYDMLDDSVLLNDLKIIQRNLYDRLSLYFSALRKKLTTVSKIANERLVDCWTSSIIATLFQLIISEFPNSEIINNSEFVLFGENEIRTLLIGFPSSNPNAFHTSVWNLLSLKARKSIPQKLAPVGDVAMFDNGVQEEAELSAAMTIEGHFEEERRHGKDILFNTNTRTGLIQNAMRLTGTKEPAEAKGRGFSKGTAEISDIVVKKCSAVMHHARKLVSEHADARDTQLLNICDCEIECNEQMRHAQLKPLGMTFETFGYDPMRGRLVLGGAQPHPDSDPKARTSWRAATKVVRKPKPEKTIREIIETIEAAHPVVLATGIA